MLEVPIGLRLQEWQAQDAADGPAALGQAWRRALVLVESALPLWERSEEMADGVAALYGPPTLP